MFQAALLLVAALAMGAVSFKQQGERKVAIVDAVAFSLILGGGFLGKDFVKANDYGLLFGLIAGLSVAIFFRKLADPWAKKDRNEGKR